MWVDYETGNLYPTHSDIRLAFPNMSLPAVVPDDVIGALGLQPVVQVPPPAVNIFTDKAVKQPPALVNGVWQQGWDVVPLTPEEIAAVEKMYADLIG